MSRSVALIAIHGMGKTPTTYADETFKRVRQKLGDRRDGVDCRAVYYQNLLQTNQDAVWQRIRDSAVVDYGKLRQFLLSAFGDAAGLENRKEVDDSVYELAQAEIAKTLLAAYQENANPNLKVVFLAHSLGCQVLSSYIYDAQKAERAQGGGNQGMPKAGIWKDIDSWARRSLGRALEKEEKEFIAARSCMALVTMGCNIPIFVAAHRNMQIEPIDPPTGALFRWLNFYDRDDVLGWPLQPLSDRYRELVQDREINAGQGLDWLTMSWNPMSHIAYWTDDDVLDPLTAMLRQLAG